MHVLVLGGNGMLGHRLARHLSDAHDVTVTVRERDARLAVLLPGVDQRAGVRADEFESVRRAVHDTRPDAVVNCIGIVKQRDEARLAIPSIAVNALFPHLLAQLCQEVGLRLVHVSTDCVFAGSRGMYREEDVPDATDLYGRTKLLGEIGGTGIATVRTSMVGWEIRSPTGLLEWFACRRGGRCTGYRRAVFSGLSALALARVIDGLLHEWCGLEGMWQVSADPIDKFTLLMMLRDALSWEVDIVPADEPVIDRSLDGSRFREATGWMPPSWEAMVQGLAAERAWYEDEQACRG
jgi:dTDP-4-dehydrorhamnose reductase